MLYCNRPRKKENETMKTFSTRTLSLLLAVLMLMGCLSGCGKQQTPEQMPEQDLQQNVNENIDTQVDDVLENFGGTTTPANTPVDGTTLQAVQANELTAFDGEQISYVMIYNPRIYADDFNSQALQTGDFSTQINIDLDRAGGLQEPVSISPYGQSLVDEEFLSQLNLEGGKADGLGKFYMVGDKENFYCGSERDLNERVEKTFTCVYAGTHANIWTYTDLDQVALEKLGTAFDESIYDECVSRFGEPRFGEVVNFLFYPLEGDPNTVGFFHTLDLFSFLECDDMTAKAYGVNRDINVINMNSLWLEEEDTIISTLAHEFQHLLCFTGYFSAGNQCDVWFNEAMSGYIEETLYPGIMENQFYCFHDSERIRYGQSLYNFGIDATMFKLDIGVYGSVYLFSEYLKNLAGEDVFSNFHANWRNTYVPLTTFEGIYQAVPAETQQQIQNLIAYPSGLTFASEYEEWMSKLTLSFYLSTFTMDENTPELYRQLALPYLLYDSMMPANIEGGGRVVLAVNDGSFKIPENADKDLIYVGLNENMQIVTNFIYK